MQQWTSLRLTVTNWSIQRLFPTRQVASIHAGLADSTVRILLYTYHYVPETTIRPSTFFLKHRRGAPNRPTEKQFSNGEFISLSSYFGNYVFFSEAVIENRH